MFYKMVNNKRDEWYESDDCTVKGVIDYIASTGKMRDAQIEAIKTYLFLKIACGCRPLAELFMGGVFNNLDIDEIEASANVHSYLKNNPAAAALFEYASLTNEIGEQVSEGLVQTIKDNHETVEYDRIFNDIFYGVEYTDYLFSLPMGAGKTFLMAAFIYLDLYFALSEPSNPAFAHNFIIFAPSGTKTSIIPSLKTIQKFDPSWIIPEPAATEIKRMVSFEVLDQYKSQKKSNKTKNPNVQKIASHQPLEKLFGLVAVTNAEKVILDKVKDSNEQIHSAEIIDDIEERQANELRYLIGKLPHLAIYIDEAHHASSQTEKKNERKLRSVFNRWSDGGNINSVLGFSGTPYLSSAEKVAITDDFKLSNTEISNIVYYYPLIEGIGNFLKRPIVKIVSIPNSKTIVERGVREFLDTYKDTVYEGGLSAKLGIYCGTIEKCEEMIFPLVSNILSEYGMSNDVILKFHGGNDNYPQPTGSALEFVSLDKPFSKKRIVLLVQIGKEGWDCQSLTGIILTQESECPTNMVLQTSCRCLRQIGHSVPGSALIYLNDSNGEKLEKQLDEQHHISVKEFESGRSHSATIKRYDRTDYLKLPQIDFYQLKIAYEDIIVKKANPSKRILSSFESAKKVQGQVIKTDFFRVHEDEVIGFIDEKRSIFSTNMYQWAFEISKEGFGAPTVQELLSYDEFKKVFEAITIEENGLRYFKPSYDIQHINANIRKAFYDSRDFEMREELIPEKSSLLNITNFQPEFVVAHNKLNTYYPDQLMVENIILDDNGELKQDEKTREMIESLRAIGEDEMAAQLESKSASHPQKDKSFHYIPYRTDSNFEQIFLREVLTFATLQEKDLEVYYNGDRAMTEFKIRCYKKANKHWTYIGMYTPDFLIIQRKDGQIHKAIIVETKGQIYANDPTFQDKRSFMETEFAKQNNKAFGYDRFDYLYLADNMPEDIRLQTTQDRITDFFGKDN